MHQTRMSSALPSTPTEQRVPTAPATINLSAGSVETVMVDGQPHIVFRPAVEAIGLDYSTQLRKLRDRSWANRRDIPTVAEDGKTRQMVAVNVPTFLMWLATVNEAKVAAAARPTLIAYQRETTTAVNDYWTRGGAINPAAEVGRPKTGAELILQMAQELVTQEHRLASIEQVQAATAAKVAAIEGRHDEFTALGYAKLHDHPTGRPYLAQVGKCATAIMREQGSEPHQRQDATFGAVNIYPVSVLERAFAEVSR